MQIYERKSAEFLNFVRFFVDFATKLACFCEAACAFAHEARTYEYNKVPEILQRGDDAAFFDDEPRQTKPFEPVEHKNIRGGEYFANN